MKKFLLICASLASLLCLTLGLAGCDFGSGGSAHEHEYTETVVAPTCTERGYTLHTCACGYSYKDSGTSALGHSWDEGTVIRAATCTAEGSVKYTCTVCQETQTGTIPALGHSWNDGEVTQEATCTEEGEIKYTCTVCHETRTETTAATGHPLVQGYVTQEATCTEEGEMTVICVVCGGIKIETIPAAGHIAGEAVAENVEDATCTASGSYESVTYCSVCGKEISRTAQTIAATGHDYKLTAWNWAEDYTSATATFTCVNDIKHIETVTVTITSEVTQAATCESTGTKVYTATVEFNGVTYTDEMKVTLSALGHEWEWKGQTEETHTGECTVCGEVLTEAAHEWEDNVCMVCGYDAGGSKGLEWTLRTEDDVQYYAVSGIGSCTDAEIVIPSVYNGVAVMSIGGSAFYNCTSLTSISIPDGVETIRSSAFYGCTGLTSITIPGSVISIGGAAFGGCSKLAEIALPFVGESANATRASSSTLFGYIFGTSSYTGGTSTKQYYASYSYTTYYIPRIMK